MQWFFTLHDPTTLNRQANDVGTQYRSALFPQTPEQRRIAERVKARVEASGQPTTNRYRACSFDTAGAPRP